MFYYWNFDEDDIVPFFILIFIFIVIIIGIALTDNTKLDLSQSSEDKKDETCITQESNISEKKQVLENFKNELLKKQQMMQKSTDKKGQILTKKIK